MEKLRIIREKLGISSDTRVGVELSTEYLYGLAGGSSITDPNATVKAGDIENSLLENIVGIIKMLYFSAGIRVLLLPVNCYTHIGAFKISDMCRELQGPKTDIRQKLNAVPSLADPGYHTPTSLTVVATDIFRAHPRRPGLFCCEDVNTLPVMATAVDELMRTLDSCMAFEKKYMEQVGAYVYLKYF